MTPHVSGWTEGMLEARARSSRRTSSAPPGRAPAEPDSLTGLPLRIPFFYGWIIVAVGFVTMAIGVSARTAFSLLFPPILDEYGWERGVTAGVFSFGFFVWRCSAAGRAVDGSLRAARRDRDGRGRDGGGLMLRPSRASRGISTRRSARSWAGRQPAA